ncbi:MAG: hypothetical protein ACI4R9_00955 [Kiritimatiellia bacterium]
MKTPADKCIVFTLYSHPMKDPEQRWKASLRFLPGSTDDSEAELTVVDGRGRPIGTGTFEFAGTRMAIREGRGRLRCGDFICGKHAQGIWLHRDGMPLVPGALTFE